VKEKEIAPAMNGKPLRFRVESAPADLFMGDSIAMRRACDAFLRKRNIEPHDPHSVWGHLRREAA
jgi:hypothetical protein